MAQVKETIKNNLVELRGLLRHLFPENKQELYLLLGFMFFYLSYGLFIGVNTSITDSHRFGADIYFSFDNPSFYCTGFQNIECHPLIMYVFLPFVHIGNVLAHFLGAKAKTSFLIVFCSFLISSSVLFVKRYLKDIIGLSVYPLLICLSLYAFSATNLIISFTLESFPLTAFFLTYMVYCYSLYIKNNQRESPLASAFFAIGLGGITITNLAKGIIPMFFTGGKFKSIFKRVLIIGCLFLVVLLWLQLRYDFISAINNRLHEFVAKQTTMEYLASVYALFSTPFLFASMSKTAVAMPHLTVGWFHCVGLYLLVVGLLCASAFVFSRKQYFKFSKNKLVCYLLALVAIPVFVCWLYHHIPLDADEDHKQKIGFVAYQSYYYILISCLMLLTCFSVLRTYKNKLVLLIIALIAVDFCIHVLAKYGLSDSPYMYGSHWIYAIPFLLGWLFKDSETKIYRKGLLLFASLVVICIIVSNIAYLTEFIRLAMSYFPPEAPRLL